MLNSTYIGETLRGGPEKKYNQDMHSIPMLGKILTWCSGEVREFHVCTLGHLCEWFEGQ